MHSKWDRIISGLVTWIKNISRVSEAKRGRYELPYFNVICALMCCRMQNGRERSILVHCQQQAVAGHVRNGIRTLLIRNIQVAKILLVWLVAYYQSIFVGIQIMIFVAHGVLQLIQIKNMTIAMYQCVLKYRHFWDLLICLNSRLLQGNLILPKHYISL